MRIDVELQSTEELNTDIQEPEELSDTEMKIGTMTEGIDPDYEKMRNQPSVNGNVLIGDKTTAQLGIGIIGVYKDETLSIRIL